MNDAFKRLFARQVRIATLAAGLLSLWMVVHLLAGVPQLHHELHEGQSSPDHQCLLTQFSSGSFEPTLADQTPQLFTQLLCEQAGPVPEPPAFQVFSPPLAPRPPPWLFQSYSQAGS